MANLKEVTTSSFDADVLQSNKTIVVDFWAEWCGPCRALAPVLEEVNKEAADKAEVVKVNVDDNGELAQRYGIRGIPTLIFFKNGKAVKTLVGTQPKSEIIASINELN